MKLREQTRRANNRRVSFNPELGSEIHLYIAYHALLLLQYRDF